MLTSSLMTLVMTLVKDTKIEILYWTNFNILKIEYIIFNILLNVKFQSSI